jgi:uncharacterized protein (DUF1015 family)
MPAVLPFRALRYSPQLGPQMAKLVAPPYDVITPAEQDALYAAHPHNIVRLILAKEGPLGDRYASAARDLAEWRAHGVLVEDAQPSLYVYAQRYKLPTGEEHTRQGFVAAVRIEEPGEGVKAHERTLAAPLEDRFRLMMATHANLSQVFALYRDPERAIDSVLTTHRGAPVASFTTSDGIEHTLWRVTDAGALATVRERLAREACIIADGHHRYETSLRYRNEMRARHPEAGPNASFEFVTVFLCNTSDPGLTILPTHRLLAAGAPFDAAKLRIGLQKHFFVTERMTPPPTNHGARLLARELQSASEKGPCFAVSVPSMPTTLVCILKPDLDLNALEGMPRAASLQKLDVTVLHQLCLEPLLGVTAEAARAGTLEYEHDTGAALTRLRERKNAACFFLPPTRIEQVFEVAAAGERMPQKSTFFFPKIASGLVLRAIDPSNRLG